MFAELRQELLGKGDIKYAKEVDDLLRRRGVDIRREAVKPVPYFTEEDKETLYERGYDIYYLTGQPLKDITSRIQLVAPSAIPIPFLEQATRIGQVAIDCLGITRYTNLTLPEQQHRIDELNKEPVFKQAQFVIPELGDYLALADFAQRIGRPILFGHTYDVNVRDHMYVRTQSYPWGEGGLGPVSFRFTDATHVDIKAFDCSPAVGVAPILIPTGK
jgi:hypothetical protein